MPGRRQKMRNPRGDATRNKNSRWPSGPRVSAGTLVSTGLFFAVFIGIAVVMDSYFILYIVIALYGAAVLVRFLRGQSLVPLIARGTDYSDSYRITGGQVSVEKDDATWVEPLSNYEGVFWHQETVRRGGFAGGRHRRQDVFQIIELRHRKDRVRDVNIYTSQETAGMRARWEEAARAFNLPSLRDPGDGHIVRREAGDLGKSLRDLARAGRLSTGFDKTRPTPRGVRWNQTGEVLELSLRKAVLPYVLIALPVALFALLVGNMVPADPLNTVIAIATPALLYALWVLVSYRIRVTPQAVTVGGNLGPLPLWRRSIPLDEIEEVLTGTAFLVWPTVLVESDRATLRAGPLSDESAQWVVEYLRSAIADAPRAGQSVR